MRCDVEHGINEFCISFFRMEAENGTVIGLIAIE